MSRQDFQERSISTQEFEQIVKGDIITYHLQPSMLPTHPLKEWHGRIERVDRQKKWVEVALLDEGYIGLSEIVRVGEIVAIAKNAI